ncbi:MAG: S-adenosylmethionine-diacylgycerolhomoserine-N-methyltransferase [Phenylobacterium sp.]|jgi:S-adenosylmethionine-diacylgycerolhomoserine-N-methlytransferase
MNQPKTQEATKDVSTKDKLIKHYEKDALIYDFNRRFFLFGRNDMITQIGASLNPTSILEIGCGTGVNLVKLGQLFPQAELTGIDLSQDMLNVAKTNLSATKNVTLVNEMFDQNTVLPKFDLILCSYITSTVPDLAALLKLISAHLTRQGHFACVDFHSSNVGAFKRWISHSIPIRTQFPEALLTPLFTPKLLQAKRAYCGIWRYFTYIGQKLEQHEQQQ